ALAGIFSCVAVAFGQNADLTGTWTRSETGSSAICKIEQTDASVSFNLKTHFSAGSLSGGMNGTETSSPDGVQREAKADSGRQRWLTAYWQGRSMVILRVVKDSYHVTVAREVWTTSEDRQTLSKNVRTIDMDGFRETTEVFTRQ
ncbi:MAG: hypothetical protein ABSF64_40315, partial [Bryobacteraceae bacterium]